MHALFFILLCFFLRFDVGNAENPEDKWNTTELINGSSFPKIKSNSMLSLEKGGVYILDETLDLKNIKNFVLEGNGAIIKAPFNGTIFHFIGGSNITLRNINIDNVEGKYFSGKDKGRITFEGVSKVLVTGIHMYNQVILNSSGPNYQLLLKKCVASTVSNGIFEESQGELVMLLACRDCVIKGNKTSGGWSGIGTGGLLTKGKEEYGFRNKILNNTVKDCTAALITVNDRQTVVERNTIFSTLKRNGEYIGGPGIRFGHVVIEDNKQYDHLKAVACKALNNKIYNIINATAKNYSTPYAIKVDATVAASGKGEIVIRGNYISDCRHGIGISNQGGQSGIIENNTIDVIDNAISVFSGIKSLPQRFSIKQNTIRNSGDTYAVRLWYSNGQVTGNNIKMRSKDSKQFAIGVANNTDAEKVIIMDNEIDVEGPTGILQINGKVDRKVIKRNRIRGARQAIILNDN